MSPAVAYYRVCRRVHLLGAARFAVWLSWFGRFIFSMWVPGSASIGKGLVLGYQGLGVVIHKDAIIGDECIISQNVTIGRKADQEGVPLLGNRVYVGAGAVLLGPIHIGDGAVIGANSVVVRDVGEGEVVAGVPARLIRIRGA